MLCNRCLPNCISIGVLIFLVVVCATAAGVSCLCYCCVLILVGVLILVIDCCDSKKKGREYSIFCKYNFRMYN